MLALEGVVRPPGLMREEFVIVDSGSMLNAVPVELVRSFNVPCEADVDLTVRGAGGALVQHFGRVRVQLC